MDHLNMEAPQVKPAPKLTRSTWVSFIKRPSRLASSRAIGIVAEEVFPYLWMFVYTFSMGICRLVAKACTNSSPFETTQTSSCDSHYPGYHVWRKVINPWEGSYGETLTSTRSPTITLIRNFFIRPERRPLTVMSLSQ